MKKTTAAAVALTIIAISMTSGVAAQDRPQTDQGDRPLMVCANDRDTRVAFRREFGQEPVFLTAEEARDAARRGESWETPRCIAEAQQARLQRASLDRSPN